MKGKALAIFAIVALLTAAPVWAGHFRPLSPQHTNYGVAQLNYGNIPGRESSTTRPSMKLTMSMQAPIFSDK